MSEDSDQGILLPAVFSTLTNAIDSDSHNFSSGSTIIHSAALNATKFLFDLGESVHVVAVGDPFLSSSSSSIIYLSAQKQSSLRAFSFVLCLPKTILLAQLLTLNPPLRG